jgi:hypothetical protein
MTLSRTARFFGKLSVWLRHANAISRGRIWQRGGNLLIGGSFSRFMRGKWF